MMVLGVVTHRLRSAFITKYKMNIMMSNTGLTQTLGNRFDFSQFELSGR